MNHLYDTKLNIGTCFLSGGMRLGLIFFVCVVYDTIHGSTCATQNWVFTYNNGKYIEGLAVLYTATGDSSYLDAATTTAVAAIKSTPNWQGTDGIITEGQGTPYSSNDDGRGFKAVYIRGLSELYRRAPGGGQSGLQILIHS